MCTMSPRRTTPAARVAATLALAAGLAAGPVPVAGAQPEPGTATAAPVLIQGRVSAPASVEVLLEARIWPNQQRLDQLEAGQAVPFEPVEDVEVFGDQYLLRLDPAALPADYVGESGVDLEVSAWTDDGVGDDEFDAYTQTLQMHHGVWVPAQLVDTGEAAPVTMDLQLAGATTAPASLAATAMEPICSVSRTTTAYQKRATVGAVMPSANAMTGRLTYTSGASHALGTAYQSAVGTVDAGATITRESSSSHSFAPDFIGRRHTARTDWRYREYKNTCTQRVHARPEAHTGGYYRPDRGKPSFRYCKGYPAGTWTRNQAEAFTFGAGVTLWGLGVNTQAGYTSDVTLQYRLNSSGNLCGSNAYPPMAKLVAGK